MKGISHECRCEYLHYSGLCVADGYFVRARLNVFITSVAWNDQ